MRFRSSPSGAVGSDAAAQPNVSAIFLILAAAIAAIVVAMWLIRWFVFPAVPAARYTLLGAIVVVPTLIVALRRDPAPGWMVRGVFGAYITAVTIGIHFGGGVDNVSGPLLYALVIGLAGLTASERAAYIASAGSLLLYGMMVTAERHDLLAHHLSYTKTGPDAVATVISVGVYLFLMAWVVSRIVRGIHSTHRRINELRTEAVAALSHDLKNPLGVIQGSAELAEKAPANDLDDHLRRIDRAARQALDLINNVLDAAALEADLLTPTRSPTDVNRLVREIVDLYEATAATKGIRLSTDLASDLPSVSADTQLLSRALGNLLSNALKFTDEGGTAEIATARGVDYVTVVVRDSGRGIPREEHERLFEKYQRASSAGRQSGSGLGLYIVRSIVAAHGGSVTVSSETPRGTAFTVRLPIGTG
jgi:signal transduction histidine kinase